MKPALLYITHRIPYPPNKGDKIRTYHFLKYLSKRYRVYLATFIDNKADLEYRQRVEVFCEEVFFAQINPKFSKVKSLAGFFRNEPLTCTYYRHREMNAWVSDIVQQENIDNLLVSSSGVASYVMHEKYSEANRIIDFIDMDSEKWRQYASLTSWPLSAVYRREARQLLRVETRLAGAFRHSFFVSEAEANLFKKRTDCDPSKVEFINNGVDLEYFSSKISCDSPYLTDEPVIVFSGAMDYWPNIDAVIYFAEEIFPLVKERVPSAKFVVVGGNPDSRVAALGEQEGITITGWVDDVRPYVLHASVSVAPLRIARGVQNKVLESMAMEVPTVVTLEALEGISALAEKNVLVGTSTAEFSAKVIAAISGDLDRLTIGKAGRELIERDFSWEENLQRIDKYFPPTGHDISLPGSAAN